MLSVNMERKRMLLYFKLANVLLFCGTADVFRCCFMKKLISCRVFQINTVSFPPFLFPPFPFPLLFSLTQIRNDKVVVALLVFTYYFICH